MKFYDCSTAPSPRRVRIFLAEKGIEIPTENINLGERAQLNDEFKAINDRCDVPFLVLDDGTGIGEVDAICRYLEELHPTPPLYGTTPTERALVTMWNHRVEQEGYFAIAEAFRNFAKGFVDRALVGPVNYPQIPELAARGKVRVGHFFDSLDARLGKSPFMASDNFTFADITAFVCVDFASRLMMVPEDEHTNIKAWQEKIAARPGTVA